MDFSIRKLPKTAARYLYRVPIESIQPYAFMLAPLYLYMRRNEKFIAVKSPMDFFLPDELEKIKSFNVLFATRFVTAVLPFRDLARRVFKLLTWQPMEIDARDSGKLDSYPEIRLPLAPYELSDAAIRLVAKSWGSGLRIEPYFVTVFVNELCEVIPENKLVAARDIDIVLFERAVFLAAWVVFLALHLGYTNYAFLNNLRYISFCAVMEGTHPPFDNRDLNELFYLAEATLGSKTTAINGRIFSTRADPISQKIASRLERVENELMKHNEPAATIHGEGGFISAVLR